MSSDGLVVVDKPVGITSFSALYPIKRHFGKKVGHTGTLDKFASGLMLVLTGRYTRLNAAFTGMDKRYDATFRFGEETDTLDPEGSLVHSAPVPDFEAIEQAVACFRGELDQVPPAYSAVHINGKRAYSEIRKGNEVVLHSRRIRVNSFDILHWDSPFLKVRIDCSKGTYIRSLARDLGRSLDSAAYVTELRRISVGPFTVEDAVQPEAVSSENILHGWQLFSRISNFKRVAISMEIALHYIHGKSFGLDSDSLKDFSVGEEGYIVLVLENTEIVVGIIGYVCSASGIVPGKRLLTVSNEQLLGQVK